MNEINPYESPRTLSSAEDDVDPLSEIACRASEDTPYPPEAFVFLIDGMRFAKEHIRHERERPDDIDAVDLSWCLHDLAMYRFADKARAQLESWNIRQTSDFGELVFRLVQIGQLRTDEGDSVDDFADIFEFSAEFKVEEFRSTILFDEDT